MSSSVAAATARLPKYPKHGSGIGLHRVQALCAALGIDLARWARRSCNVAGSSGKGSVATTTAAMLQAAGLKVGCFTSPHLHSVHERFTFDAVPIDDAALMRHWPRVEAACDALAAEQGEGVGGFEFLYLVALCWFQEQGADAVVFECGIGGRYDPTRLGRPAWAALVSVDLEHTELLGRTLAEIACDKSDTVAVGGTLFLGDSLLPLRPLLTAYAGLRDVGMRFVAPEANWSVIALEMSGTRLRVCLPSGEVELHSPLAGHFQCNNLAIAAHLADAMLREGFGRSADEARAALVAGAARVRWPGRLQVLRHQPPLVIDVGHTPRAVRLALASWQALLPAGAVQHAVLVCGVSADKRAAEIVGLLAPVFRRIVCTRAHHRGLAAEEILQLARGAQPSAECRLAPGLREACAMALAWAGDSAPVYVAGGLFLAIEFEAAFHGDDPAALRFY